MRSFIVVLALFGMVGCDGDQELWIGDVCDPGEVQECPCLGGDVGVQACMDGGNGWEACACEGGEGEGEGEDSESTTRDTGLTDDTATTTEAPEGLIEWVQIDGGTFYQGDEDVDNQSPVRQVTVATFDMAKTEVMVTQFRACVAAGACTYGKALEDGACFTKDDENPLIVQGCLAFDDMQDFCAWVGGRLPTESEWEYAARNRGAVHNPWGDEPINGVQERANIGEWSLTWSAGQNPCTAAPLGITQQGVCDLIGNVDEVVLDTWSEDYVGHPKDGSAWTAGGSDRVCRGGGFRHAEVDEDGVPISGTWRHPCGGTLGAVDTKRIDRGFRCVR